MGLNIKNERVHALAREAARVTGKTQTGAIEVALERLLAEQTDDRERRRQAILDAAEAWRAKAVMPLDGFDTDDLYGEETGLPT